MYHQPENIRIQSLVSPQSPSVYALPLFLFHFQTLEEWSLLETLLLGIHGFDHKYVLVGGMNSPKKIVVTGTNGRKYNMLLKV